jgi:hypothetical protein
MMTAPTMKPASRKPAFAEPSTADVPVQTVGPDFTQTVNDPPVADPTPKRRRSFNIGNTSLGKNKKVRSDVRKLTENDEKVLTAWYQRIGKMLQFIRPELGTAIINQSEDCAHSWCELADKNDKVRHAILAVIEGGEWGKVVGAHAPILLAALPEKAVERFMLKGMGMFAAFMSNDDTNDETTVDDEITAGRMI